MTEEDSSFDDVTEKEFYEALFDLVRNGLLRPTGEYRNGQPVYVAVLEDELSDEAKAYLNKIKRHGRTEEIAVQSVEVFCTILPARFSSSNSKLCHSTGYSLHFCTSRSAAVESGVEWDRLLNHQDLAGGAGRGSRTPKVPSTGGF